MELPVSDCRTVGHVLAEAPHAYTGREGVIVSVLPRDGVPVAQPMMWLNSRIQGDVP